MQASPVVEVDRAMVLGKATARAAAALGLTGKGLAQVVGYSEPTISRILAGDRGIEPDSKEGELALLLVRVFRSLDALVGGSDASRATWMSTYNNGLNGIPVELIKTAEGLVRTLAYLDGMRAPS
jgi:transcriptional regulator with XRE-family HTH domain